jgi:diguanylate cyclase (GGDEF)-like protein
VDRRGDILDASPGAGALVGLWHADRGVLHETVHGALASGLPADARLEDADGNSYWLVAVPQGRECVIVSRDTTLPDKVTSALLESRTLLKELLDASVDVAFEVDRDQCFRFVTPHEALGLDTDSWLGERASRVFWPDGDVPARNPFKSTKAGEFENVPVELPDGRKCWLYFRVRPKYDETGKMVALRGTCRDTSNSYLSERQSRRDSLRFMLLQRITGAINQAEGAEETLDHASAVLQEVLRADMVWAAMKFRQGLVPSSVIGSHREILDLDSIWHALGQADTPVISVDGEARTHLALRLERGQEGLGMVIISRDTSISPWSEQEVELLGGVVDVLTAAFRKAELIETLYRLSSNDELTGLLNRRALEETINRRLKHQVRTGLSGCLVFIDLDHFKEVNDTLGHRAGDKALELVAAAMTDMIRPCDYAGRYGGDEFILWFEDMDVKTAVEKARILIEAMPGIREAVGSKDLKLGASVGVCQAVPGRDMEFTALADRADAVLYEVKGAGRGDVAVASLEGD